MKMKTAFLLFALAATILLNAHDRNKSANELENISLNAPGETAKRSYSVKSGYPYAVSALVSGSQKDIAWIEVKLFKDKKQCNYFRSLRNTEKTERIEIIFNAGCADRAEVSCILLQDALPGTNAQFKEYRFVSCDDITIQPWERRSSTNCRRKISDNGAITLTPNGNRALAYSATQLSMIMPNTKMRFSADIKAEAAEHPMLMVNGSGGKDKSMHPKSSWNSKKEETLFIDFDTKEYKSITLYIRCNNGKKHKNRPVTFSNIRLTVIPQNTK